MKLLNLVLISGAIFMGQFATAHSVQKSLQQNLTKVYLDNKLKARHVGVLDVNFVKNQITLNIYDDICGSINAKPGQIHCMAMPMHIASFTVPLQQTTTSCGSNIYTGTLDQTPVDGPRQTIIVTDHSRRLCKDVVESKILVSAKSYNPWNNSVTVFKLLK